MNNSTPGLPVHHKLPEFTQPHVHRVGDAIQPSHPLSSPSPPAPNPSQHQGLFQYWSFSFSFSPSNEHQDWYPLGWTGGSLCSPRDSQESSPTPQFKSINFSVLSFLHLKTLVGVNFYQNFFLPFLQWSYFFSLILLMCKLYWLIWGCYINFWGFPGGSEGKASAYNAGDLGSIPGSGRSPGEGNGNPLLYSCLENPVAGGAW